MATEIYFVTNRNPVGGEPPTSFGKEINHSNTYIVRFGIANVQDDGSYTLSVIGEDANGKPNSSLFSDHLRERMLMGEDTLAYIHGFDVSFDACIQAAIKMKRLYETDGQKYAVVVFSWPSNGNILDYVDDRFDAQASGPALGRVLVKADAFLRDFKKKLAGQPACNRKVHLLAHSMGNYVLRNALQAALKLSTGNNLTRLFDQVILAASDEDADSLELDYKLKPLCSIANQVTVYYNQEDIALTFSDNTKNNPTRLGSVGPLSPFQVPGNVSSVDCHEAVPTALDTLSRKDVGHSYYLTCPKVVEDIQLTLSGSRASVLVGKTRQFDSGSHTYWIT